MLIYALMFMLRLVPVRLLGALGAGLGRLAYLFDRRHRQIVLSNLDRIYPERDEAWKIRIAHESFAELGRTSFELPHVYLRSKAFLLSRIELCNPELLDAAKAANQGVILAACHHSNWELGGLSLSMLGHTTDVIYRPIRQPSLDHFIRNARSRFGAIFHPREAGLRWIPRALKQNHLIAVMVDQHLSNGTPVPFLGHAALTTTMPALFTNKYRTPVVSVILHRIGRGFRFRLEFLPVTIDSGDELQTMEAIGNSFAPAIHARPELWLWLHRRWLYLDEQEQA